MGDLSKFEFLRPSAELCELLDPSAMDVKVGKGKNAYRKIFFGRVFDDYERAQLATFEEYLISHSLRRPAELCAEDKLRFCYAGKFDCAKAFTVCYVQQRA
eukprot:TRINITY_DN2650_c0_g1_i8.p2 TRINITY_DN2650_c0_g1~~TRINITY_DN2650_c0_g1_i8.p2  ORF type:complete len:101 (+),score=15.08 TRINITY_DN2650_c0_g1_i8:62-364(+)